MSDEAIGRLVPEEPFPPYTYVPRSGRPHPLADPRGHSFGRRSGAVEPLDPDRPGASRPYLVGIDLFNHGYFWEAHESWESVWHACGRSGTVADFVRALIKLAAAGVKALEGVPNGVRTHSARAAVLWRAVAAIEGGEDAVFLGFRLLDLIGLADSIARDGWPEDAPVLRPSFGESRS